MDRRITFLIGSCLVAALIIGNSLPSQAEDYGTGFSPMSVAIGDLNGDGNLDLAVANRYSYNISVLLGNGDGTFQAAVNYDAGGEPYAVAIGYLDGDNDLDLAVANPGSENISVLLNNGDGTFQAAVSYGAGSGPISVAMGDLDGDDDLDLAVANNSSKDVSVLLGNGDGTFQGAVNYGVGVGSYPYSVAIGDLNGDGHPDIAVANDEGRSGNVSVLLNNGDGTFQAAVSYGAGIWPSSVAIGDLDGDSAPDLAVANTFGHDVSILLGNRDGTFQAAVNYGVGNMPFSVTIGDLDGDNALDLAVANMFSGYVSVLLGNGNGTFQQAGYYGAGDSPSSVAMGDLDGDNDLDLAVANYSSNNVSVLLGNGDGTFPEVPEAILVMNVSYSAGKLNFDFVLAAPEPVVWGTFLILIEPTFAVIPLWETPIPEIYPPISIPVSFRFPKLGWIVLLTSIGTPEGGSSRFDFQFVYTGSP